MLTIRLRPDTTVTEKVVMATRLKDTDVVVVGLGAAGGVAVLPLAQAGINVDRPRSRHVAHQARLRAGRTA